MIILLHGENVSASREALVELKKNYSADSVSVFDVKKFDADEFIRACQTPSLLSDRRLIVIEGKLPSSPHLLISSSLPSTTDVIFWLGEELKPSGKLFKQVKELGGQIRVFKEVVPKHVFCFLDALGYKNKQKAFLELHRLLDQGESPLYLLTMIEWQVRNLLKVQSAKGKVQNMHPFVLRKIRTQLKNFGEDELVSIFRKIFEAEIALKTTQQDSTLVLDRLVSKTVQ